MNKKHLSSLMKHNPWMRDHISFGFSNEKICLTHNIFTRKYQVFISERGLKHKYRSFKDKDQVVEYLWVIFGGNDTFDRLKEENG